MYSCSIIIGTGCHCTAVDPFLYYSMSLLIRREAVVREM